jgi:hypothetical protein
MSLLQSIPSVWACASGQFDDGIETSAYGSYLREVEKREALAELRKRKRAAESKMLAKLRDGGERRCIVAYFPDGSIRQYYGGKAAARFHGITANGIRMAVYNGYHAGKHHARFCYLGQPLKEIPAQRKPVIVGGEAYGSIQEAVEACATTRRRLEEALKRGKLRYRCIVVGNKPYPSIRAIAREYHVDRHTAERWAKLGRIAIPRRSKLSFKSQPVIVTKREIEVAA